MIVYPAIDIRGGKAVQLVEGDFDRESEFDADPADAARRWASLGAEWLHIVDLDGARDGIRTNLEAILRIRQAVDIPIQLGGGLRTMDDLEATSALGVNRMIIGSSAVTDPELVTAAVRRFGGAIAIGLDARDGMLATHGWLSQTLVPALDVAHSVAEAGVETIIFTDIGRDGNLTGPNIDSLEVMIHDVPAEIIASGGIGSLSDFRRVRETGAHGVIIGTALYRKQVSLPAAIAISSGAQS